MTSEPASSGAPGRYPGVIFGLCIALLGAGYLMMPAYAELADQVGYMLRVTARIAFAFFVAAYVARPMVVLVGKGRLLVANRRYLGLAMALAHTVHFVYVVASLRLSPEPLDYVILIFGGLAFVLMWAMAATSNDAAMRAMKHNWKRLHRFGLHYLWLIFTQSFAGRVFGEDPYYLYSILTVIALAALAMRVAAYRRQRARRTT